MEQNYLSILSIVANVEKRFEGEKMVDELEKAKNLHQWGTKNGVVV